MMDVLVVDDEPVSRMAVAQTLQAAGYGVTVASTGAAALAHLSRAELQLIVCDWNMPGMSGLEFCRHVRSAGLHRYIYILMLTSHSRTQDVLDGLEAGADDYVTKPFNPAELVLRMNTGRRIVCADSRDMTIFALAKLAESRDLETGAHLERVRSYSKLLAQKLRNSPTFRDAIDDEYVRLIYDTSPLHDIGKVAIPDAILLKPGELTPDEFAVMKTHTELGAHTLASVVSNHPNAEFLIMAHEIALCHHERFDGGGYPYGVAGDDIPLSARIVALADAYDAMTSERSYKAAYPHYVARSIIIGESGKQFDPAIVNAFLAAEAEFVEVQERYTDERECTAVRRPSQSDAILTGAGA